MNKIKWIKWIAYIVIASFIIRGFIFPGEIGSSNGNHTGIVTAVEHNSNIIWSADVVYFKTDRESSQENRYCVNDETVKNQLIEASKNKKEVTIFYKNDYIMWKWQCNGGETIIYKVEGI